MNIRLLKCGMKTNCNTATQFNPTTVSRPTWLSLFSHCYNFRFLSLFSFFINTFSSQICSKSCNSLFVWIKKKKEEDLLLYCDGSSAAQLERNNKNFTNCLYRQNRAAHGSYWFVWAFTQTWAVLFFVIAHKYALVYRLPHSFKADKLLQLYFVMHIKSSLWCCEKRKWHQPRSLHLVDWSLCKEAKLDHPKGRILLMHSEVTGL